MALLWYTVLGIVAALTAWLVNQIAPNPWFTVPRTIILILATVVVAAAIQIHITANPSSPGATPKLTTATSNARPSDGSSETSRNALLASPEAPAEPPVTYLSSLPALGGGQGVYDTDPVSINGHLHPYSVTLVWSNDEAESAEYTLGGNYTRFSAVLGIRDDSEQGDPPNLCHWRILGDDKELKIADTARKSPFEVKALYVKGVVHLKIEAILARGMPQPINPAPCAVGDARAS